MITDKLFHWAARTPNHPYMVFGERTIDYRSMARIVNTLAHRLQAMGVARGDRVALMCGNRPAFLAAWFAVSELGAIAVPLNTALVGDGLRYTLQQSGSHRLLIEPGLLLALSKDISALALPPECIEIDASMETFDPDDLKANVRVAAGEAAGQRSASSPNSFLYTSGTTGLPKAAVIPHGSYEAAGRDMTAALDLTADDRIMVFLPLFHANPQMYAVASTLHCGATLVLLPRFSASRFFDDARRFGATGFTYVGTVLSILEKHHSTVQRGHGLRWGVGGGAPARVWQDVEGRFGVLIRELYGMTETGGWVTMNTPAASRFGSVGQARPAVTIAIRDAQGRDLPAGSKGEIVARDASRELFLSEYWQNEAATSSTLRDGWLYTGDRGWLDDDGFLFFDGRVKELIRRGGEMISPVEIEQQLLKHPDVLDCVVVATPDDILGEEIKALVVVARPIDFVALRDFLAGLLPLYMHPRYFGQVDAIPKTETQKVKRHEVDALDTVLVDTSFRQRNVKETT